MSQERGWGWPSDRAEPDERVPPQQQPPPPDGSLGREGIQRGLLSHQRSGESISPDTLRSV